MNIKRFIYTPLALIALIASSSAFSGMDMDSRVSQLEKEIHQSGTENAMGTFGANTVSARPNVDGSGWILSGDALFWRASIGGTEYAYIETALDVDRMKGKTQHVDFDTNWGLRLGLGYNVQYDGWDLLFQYTGFNTTGHSSEREELHNFVVQLRACQKLGNVPTPRTEAFTYCGNVRSTYDFKYQSFDLDLGRSYFMSSKLSLRPHIGLKSAWIDQTQKTFYRSGNLRSNIVYVKDDSNFKGIGPRFGSDSQWHLMEGFSVIGNIATAVLYGRFNVDHKERESACQDLRVFLNDHQYAFSPMVQMKLGLHYDTSINDNKQFISVGIGYEAEYWWKQNQMFHPDQTPTCFHFRHVSEDISMHGLTIDLKLDF